MESSSSTYEPEQMHGAKGQQKQQQKNGGKSNLNTFATSTGAAIPHSNTFNNNHSQNHYNSSSRPVNNASNASTNYYSTSSTSNNYNTGEVKQANIKAAEGVGWFALGGTTENNEESTTTEISKNPSADNYYQSENNIKTDVMSKQRETSASSSISAVSSAASIDVNSVPKLREPLD